MVAAILSSERPGIVKHLSKTFTLFGAPFIASVTVHFWKGQKTLGDACAVLPLSPASPLRPWFSTSCNTIRRHILTRLKQDKFASYFGIESRSKHRLSYWSLSWPFSVSPRKLRNFTTSYRVQLKCDGTRWCTGGEVKGKLANGVGSQYPSHYLATWCIQHYYRWCAHLGCQQSTELTSPPIVVIIVVRY